MNMSQLSQLSELKKHWERFQNNHPKVLRFFQAVYQNALEEGTVIEMRVTSPEGACYETSLKLNADDIDTVNVLQNLR